MTSSAHQEVVLHRPYKTVYRDGDRIIKKFTKEHGKANVFNEALCIARVEESGLDIPAVIEVSAVEDGWALAIEYVEGETLEALMEKEPDKTQEYMGKFVDLQLDMHARRAPRLTNQKDKYQRKISGLRGIVDATIRYELHTRLDTMPAHSKLCHGDFNPSNVIVRPDGSMTIVDWSHATQGNASGDAAITYLQFALKDQGLADLYLELFCRKSDTAKQYVQKWMPIAAAVELNREIPAEKDFLLRWIDVLDFQ